jgi:hypothetical protein
MKIRAENPIKIDYELTLHLIRAFASILGFTLRNYPVQSEEFPSLNLVIGGIPQLKPFNCRNSPV